MEAKKPTNPLKVIREFCLSCVGNSSNEVKMCPSVMCPLYPFRFGRNPYRKKREMSDEQREAAAERLKKAREEAKKE